MGVAGQAWCGVRLLVGEAGDGAVVALDHLDAEADVREVVEGGDVDGVAAGGCCFYLLLY